MPPQEEKAKLRKLKRKIKQQGNQRTRHRTKQLLNHDPDSPELNEQPNYQKLTSETLNGLDKDKTRKTDYHQGKQPAP